MKNSSTYVHVVLCDNCDSGLRMEIQKGTPVYAFKEKTRCKNCGLYLKRPPNDLVW